MIKYNSPAALRNNKCARMEHVDMFSYQWCSVRSQAEAAVFENLLRLKCSSVPARSVWLKFPCRKGSSAEPKYTSCNPLPPPRVHKGFLVLEDSLTDTKSCGHPEREERKELKRVPVELASALSYKGWLYCSNSAVAQTSGISWMALMSASGPLRKGTFLLPLFCEAIDVSPPWRTWFRVTRSSCAVCLICSMRVFISAKC